MQTMIPIQSSLGRTMTAMIHLVNLTVNFCELKKKKNNTWEYVPENLNYIIHIILQYKIIVLFENLNCIFGVTLQT